MCQKLVVIKNPNVGRRAYGQEYGSLITVNPNLVPRSEFIQVPCGVCPECRANYVSSVIQRAVVESMFSYVYFITLTYSNKHLPHIDLNGERFFYCDYNHIINMFKRFRANNHLPDREFRYLCVSEYGEKKHRPHFHILMFVSKLDSDSEQSPFIIQDLLFKHLGKYFSINTGTRKNPVYEQLFSYTYKNGRTNYYVKYVNNDQFLTCVNNDFVVKHHNVKAIRYLVNYTFKPSKFEEHVNSVIESYKDDTVLYKRLKLLLRCKINYSKDFGCGFTTVNGKRNHLDKISVRCSSNVHCYTEISDSLPSSYQEFQSLYPDFNEELLEWRKRDFYQHFSTWRRCLNSMDAEQYMLHCVYLKYFREEFNHKYNRYKRELEPKISNLFNFCNKRYEYNFKVVRTNIPVDSPIYKFLRQMVDESISKKLLFIAFKLDKNYLPMCKYYRERVSTFTDQYNLYKALGVETYEDWLDLFQKELNNRKAVEAAGNKHKYYNDDLIEEGVQFLDNSEYLYNYVFSNCNEKNRLILT